MLTFFLNGKRIEETELAGDLTVLRYLRSHKNLVGTKEGCASGDCGACTVLVGTYIEDGADSRWHYHSANACILFMTKLAGRSLVTVDALANGKDMHPAQEALKELHGSQCGFCTPGFVVSMAGLYENRKHQDRIESVTRQDIEVALSGNLCRCTGYRPIIEASEAMFDEERYPHKHPMQVWQPKLDASSEQEQAVSNPQSQSWAPTTETQLQDLLTEHPDARVVAGATDLALLVTQMHQSIPKLISLNEIASLKTLELTEDNINIGAALSYSEAEDLLSEHYPEFGAMLQRLGSRQIRNSGTLGGNIANASPIGDTPPVLIALGAEITLASSKGERRLPLGEFFIDYKVTVLQAGEYIQAIHLPRLKEKEVLKVYKISKRLEDDISAVLFAAKISIDADKISAIRTGFGGMAEIPKSSPTLEEALLGKTITELTFEQAAQALDQDFRPIDDVRASARYRLQVAKGLVQKCGIELMEPERLSRIEQIHSANLSNIVEVRHA